MPFGINLYPFIFFPNHPTERPGVPATESCAWQLSAKGERQAAGATALGAPFFARLSPAASRRLHQKEFVWIPVKDPAKSLLYYSTKMRVTNSISNMLCDSIH